MTQDYFDERAALRLPSRRALITGGTSGIGLETARAFLAEGARLIVTGSSDESVRQAQEELGSDVVVLRSNAADVQDQRELAATVSEHFGQLDVAFLNAGTSLWQPIEDWDEQTFDRIFATNVKGPYFLVQALLPFLANPASIVLNASAFAHIGVPMTSVCTASKAALLSLIKTLSSELMPRGIRVNAVSPGPIDTPIFDKIGLTDENKEQAIQEVLGRSPTGRFGHPREIANAVVFLASSASAWTIGSEFIIDGVRLLGL